MIKVGDKEVIFAQTFLVLVKDTLWIETTFGEDPLKVAVKFEDDPIPESSQVAPGPSHPQQQSNKSLPAIRISSKEDHAEITLINWRVTSGSPTIPMQLGSNDKGQLLWLMLECSRGRETARLTVQIMTGGAK